MMGAMTLTSCARQAIFTTSQWLMRVFRRPPNTSMSRKVYLSSKRAGACTQSGSVRGALCVQMFHSSKLMYTLCLERSFACT